MALVRLVVVGDHGRVSLESIPVEWVALVGVILLPVLLEEEADETGKYNDTNKGTGNNADDGTSGRRG